LECGWVGVNLFLTLSFQPWIALVPASASICHYLLVRTLALLIVHPWATGDARGGSWSNGMSGRELRAEDNLLSAFALMIGGAFGVGLPMTLLIIWLCS
jgi:hypothetical protein